jgi:hypothetical protein
MNAVSIKVDARVRARFWSKVIIQRGDGCWIWDGQSDNSKGYGRFALDNKRYRKLSAHRASWLINCGPIPSGLFVCHKCGHTRMVRGPAILPG